MTWGKPFGIVHIATLIVAVVIFLTLYFSLRKASNKVKTIVLGVLSFGGIVAIIYNMVKWNSPIEYLPLHMCAINAMLLPFAVFSKNKWLCNLLIVWCIGALFSIVFIEGLDDYELFSDVFILFYFPHILEFSIPILLFALKMVKLDPKCIVSTVLITVAIYTGVHFANVAINNYCKANNIMGASGYLVQVNYMFSIIPSNSLLQLFYKIIPYEYWYMLVAVPLIVLILLVIYLPIIIKNIKARKVKNNIA